MQLLELSEEADAELANSFYAEGLATLLKVLLQVVVVGLLDNIGEERGLHLFLSGHIRLVQLILQLKWVIDHEFVARQNSRKAILTFRMRQFLKYFVLILYALQIIR